MMNARLRTKGFTLIASLLLLLLLSGIAIGLMMMVNTEGKVGGTDLQNNIAFHAAEGGIEKMTSDLASTFQNAQSPTAAQVCNLSNNLPTMSGITWKDYTVTPGQLGQACPSTLSTNEQFGQISSGPNQGLYAQIIPINMLATAQTMGGQEVSMTRSAQVALIPVFQFGVFSDGDLGFFSSPNLNFAGRVATNADLYLGVANGYTLTFHDKLSAYGNVVTAVLPNGLSAASNNDSGTVLIPTAAQGCDGTQPNCLQFTQADGSVVGAGGNPPQSSQNSSWPTISLSTYNGEIIDGNYGNSGGTGARKLSLPFVSGTSCPGSTLACPYQIIRRPPAGELPTSAIGTSREYNMAQIHVLLSDNPAELPSGSVRLANVTGATPSNPYGIATSYPTGTNAYIPTALTALSSGTTYNMYFAAGSNAIPDETTCVSGGSPAACPTASTISTLPSDWPYAPATPPTGASTLLPTGAPLITGAGGTTPPSIGLCPPAPNSHTVPSGCSSTAAPGYPYYSSASTATWNLLDGYLYVEYLDSSGAWHNVTNEWLGLGFARGLTPPTASMAGTPAGGSGNPINPNAILLLQEPSDRRGNGVVNLPQDHTGIAPVCTATTPATSPVTPSSTKPCSSWSNALPPEFAVDSLFPTPPSSSPSPWFGVTSSSTATQSQSMFNWYPINFYDAREGEPRDTNWGNDTCTTNGMMNAVEIDVGNLKQWLSGAIGSSGSNVNYTAQNGYVLYFSDRRGMLPNPNWGNVKSGDSGLEDVVNSSSSTGVPDGVLEPIPAGKSLSPEDVNENNALDNFGTANLGLGFYNGTTNLNGAIVAASPDNPYTPRITTCSPTGRKNWVSGARHVLRLVDGSLGNVPLITSGSAAGTGGFTVASENPVYVLGDYNSNSTDPFWSGGADASGHSAAAVIGDAVTVLSDSWADLNSMTGVPTQAATYRTASTTYYRLAIAGGKNMSFPFPSWENSTDYGFGTDGGVHNFLRFLEDWSGSTLNYGGSLVSLYYATYNTGLFKCCTYSVYQPPTRNYIFDSDFTVPQGLPPGTPLFRDVDSLGYRQLFTVRSY
jgi:Tfp pilus assembly protein PilX